MLGNLTKCRVRWWDSLIEELRCVATVMKGGIVRGQKDVSKGETSYKIC